MTEQDNLTGQLPLEGPGRRLRNAREAAGLSRGDVAAQTRIAERHLVAIEEDRFSDLASRTYAVGFSRSYARTVGLDEMEIADAVREALSEQEDQRNAYQIDTFEPGDPARIPSSRLAWMAGFGIAIVVLLILLFRNDLLFPAGELPDLLQEDGGEQSAVLAEEADVAAPAIDPNGLVVFTALEDSIWVKIYDASGTQLFQKQMKQGESYTLPSDADGPQIWTARPDALKITIGGKEVDKLSETQETLRDVPVSASALLARVAQEDGVEETAAPVAPSTMSSAPVTAPSTRTTRTTSGGVTASPAPVSVSAPEVIAPVSRESADIATTLSKPSSAREVTRPTAVVEQTSQPAPVLKVEPAPVPKPTGVTQPVSAPEPLVETSAPAVAEPVEAAVDSD